MNSCHDPKRGGGQNVPIGCHIRIFRVCLSAFPAPDVIEDNEIRQELDDIHVPLRRQIQRIQSRPGLEMF